MSLNSIHRQMKRFRLEVMDDPKAAKARGLHISGLFVDRKDKQHRVIVLAHTDSDHAAVEAVVKEYFGSLLHKVKYHDERPKATLDAGTIIADASGGFATVGGFFFIGQDKSQVYGLSNNHVLAGCNTVPKGSPIQDINGNRLGTLADFVPLEPVPAVNPIDMAIFALDAGIDAVWQPFKPKGVCFERDGLQVVKVGAKTGFTKGSIRPLTLKQGFLDVEFMGETYRFSPLIAIKGQNGFFSDEGDSGSLVFTPEGQLVGLLFAILGEYSYATPIRKLSLLKLGF